MAASPRVKLMPSKFADIPDKFRTKTQAELEILAGGPGPATGARRNTSSLGRSLSVGIGNTRISKSAIGASGRRDIRPLARSSRRSSRIARWTTQRCSPGTAWRCSGSLTGRQVGRGSSRSRSSRGDWAAHRRRNHDASVKPYRGPPITLGSAAAAKLCLMVWCKACGHRSEPDPAEQARWCGPETTVR